MAAGTAYRSAIAARMSSVRTVAKAISPGSRRRREDSDNERADDARAAVEGSEARCHAREELERVESRTEQQPAEAADACDTQNKSDDEHGRGAVAICVGIDFGAISSMTRLPDHAARSIV
jgi:hypothetical protein